MSGHLKPRSQHRHALGEITANQQVGPPKPQAGEKRPIDLAFDEHDGNTSDGSSGPDITGYYIDKNADQVRRMINALIDNGEMKVGEFQKKIGVSSNSYQGFMHQNGPDKGVGSDTFFKAWKFFKKRQLQGKPPPRKKAKASGASAGSASNSTSQAKTPGSETASTDLSHIVLEGEQHDSVSVYDSCDEIRKKINAHLRKDGVVQAAFLRDLKAQYHTHKAPAKLQSSQLAKFRSQKGPYAGNTSSLFYAAYCFFEKLRVAEGKKKSQHRLNMESIHGAKGLEIDRQRNWCYAPAGSKPVMDQYGQVSIVGRGRR